jgi:hypothetical protein
LGKVRNILKSGFKPVSGFFEVLAEGLLGIEKYAGAITSR